MPERNAPSPWMLAAATLAGWLALGTSRHSRIVPAALHRKREAEDSHRAAEERLGREAQTPREIPRRGWWMILKRTILQAMDDRLLTEAAGVTFYVLLAAFPALAALVSLFGMIADPATIGEQLAMLEGVIPASGMALIEDQVHRLTSKPQAALGFGAIVGLLVSLWSANQATKAVFDALNVVYEETEKRSFIRFTLVSLAFTLGGLVFAVIAMAAVIVLPVILSMVWVGPTAELVLRLARWPLLVVMVALIFSALYRFGPSRRQARWRWVSWGSAVAAVLWLIVSLGFSWYVENFASYDETYGSLGAVIGFMTWVWLSAAVVLLGGELNAEMEHQTARDSTAGPEKPLGRRGARMADTVGT